MRGSRWEIEAVPAWADEIKHCARFQVGIRMRRVHQKLKDAGLFMERVDRDPEKGLGREVRLGQANLTGRRDRGRVAIAPDKDLSA